MLLELENGPLKPLYDHLKGFEDVTNNFDATRKQAEKISDPTEAGQLRERLKKLFVDSPATRSTKFSESILKRWGVWERLGAFGRIQPRLGAVGAATGGAPQTLPWLLLDTSDPSIQANPVLTQLRQMRIERRKLMDKRNDLQGQGKDLSEEDQKRLDEIEQELDLGDLEVALRVYELKPWQFEPDANRRYRLQIGLFSAVLGNFSKVLTEARNEQLEKYRQSWPKLPVVCMDGVDLITSPLEEAQDRVGRAALINRLDLMNARSELVDAWRKIAVFANSLLGVFNVQYHMDGTTPPTENRPLQFSGSRTRHQLILNYELPLVRKQERNNYRASLISYQRERRALMSFEDNVLNDVRSEIRSLRVLAENYKIQQRQVELAYSVVENSLDVLEQPVAPGQAPTAGNAASLTQQLLNAQRSLPSAQIQLFTFWIQYLTARMQLYRDMELLPLDDRGVWIDDVANQFCPCPRPDDQSGDQRRDGDPEGPAPESLSRPRLVPDLP